jgi:hypothetical protein
MRVRRHTTRLLTLAVFAMSVIVIPVMTAGDGVASSRHLYKNHKRTSHRLTNALASEEFHPAAPARNFGGDVCPGNARGIDCRIWPPPIKDDPDRRNGSGDGM